MKRLILFLAVLALVANAQSPNSPTAPKYLGFEVVAPPPLPPPETYALELHHVSDDGGLGMLYVGTVWMHPNRSLDTFTGICYIQVDLLPGRPKTFGLWSPTTGWALPQSVFERVVVMPTGETRYYGKASVGVHDVGLCKLDTAGSYISTFTAFDPLFPMTSAPKRVDIAFRLAYAPGAPTHGTLTMFNQLGQYLWKVYK